MLSAGLASVKPPRWNAGPYLCSPEWRWAWRDCVFAAPLWEGAGDPYDMVSQRPLVRQATLPWRQGNIGSALDFGPKASSDYIVVADDPALRCPGSFTVAVLCKTDISGITYTGFGPLVSKGGASETAGQNHNYLLLLDDNTFSDDQTGTGWCLLFERSDSAGANVSCKYVPASLPAGTRVLLTGVLDVVAQEMRVYVDGVLRRTRATTFTAETNSNNLAIGRFAHNTDSSGDRWDGPIEGAWIWKDKAFTDAEAATFARDPFGMFRMGRRVASVLGVTKTRTLLSEHSSRAELVMTLMAEHLSLEADVDSLGYSSLDHGGLTHQPYDVQ